MTTDPIDQALIPVAKRAEQIARRMSVDAGLGEAAWETFLIDAYDELLPEDLGDPDDDLD